MKIVCLAFSVDTPSNYSFPFKKKTISEAFPMVSLLKKLGIESIGTLALPSHPIRTRFQRLDLRLKQRAQGLYTLQWPSFKKPYQIKETVLTDESLKVQSLEPLLFLLRGLSSLLTAIFSIIMTSCPHRKAVKLCAFINKIPSPTTS